MNETITAIVSIVLALIGLAALATVLSNKASTSNVINAASGGLATDIGAATSPVTGSTIQTGSLVSSIGSGV